MATTPHAFRPVPILPRSIRPAESAPQMPPILAADNRPYPTFASQLFADDSLADENLADENLDDENLSGDVLLGCRGLRKSYRKGGQEIPVLRGVDLSVREGEFLAVVGQSGSGKSTLLHLLGTLDRPDAGEVLFENHRIDNLATSVRDLLRNKYIGMIFQFYHLLPELTTEENILAPAYIGETTFGYWRRRRAYRQRAAALLQLTGLAHRARHKPRELSGGEMQRAAIARALLARPRVLLADEPTGNLDRHSGEQILATLVELKRRENLTIVMVTHDSWVAAQADRVVHLAEGRLVRDPAPSAPRGPATRVGATRPDAERPAGPHPAALLRHPGAQ